MLTLGIRYLTGCVVASDVADRSHVEWPPHPGRVFMALAAAHFQTGEDPAERVALEWLEEQIAAPQISAPGHFERPVVTHYVPVNDKLRESASGVTRERQPRTFARAWLENEVVYLIWPDAEPGTHFSALESLCGKVTRIGHSSSLVQMWASEEAPGEPANWLPDEDRATEHFRVPGPGVLRYLGRQFNQVQMSTRLRPELSLSHGYAPRGVEPKQAAMGTVFDPRLLVFGLRRRKSQYRYLDLAATLRLTGRIREALLDHLATDIPEVLSGHSGQAASDRPHIAILPLPFVGREHAHGGILGAAIALPRDIEAGDRERLLLALAALGKEGLKLGPLGEWLLESPEAGPARDTLRDRVWTAAPGGARQWATVTPYVLDRHSKAKDRVAYERELADAVRTSWERVQQSAGVKVDVAITPVSAHVGAPASHEFPRLARKDGSECRHTHAILIFDRPVTGPVLLGAGRFRGYGLFRPLYGGME